MFTSLTKNWWKFLLRGLLAIVFGVLAIAWPKITLFALVFLFGAFAILDGILDLSAGIAFASYIRHWWVVLLEGVTGILAGIAVLLWPNISWVVLIGLVAAWALISGAFELVAGIRLRKVIDGEWMLILGGALSILLCALLIVFPQAGAIGLVWTLGAFAILDGIRNIVFSARLKGVHHDLKQLEMHSM